MNTADTLLAEARQALAENRLEAARQAIKRALGRAPQRVDLLAAAAYIALAGGDAAAAAQTCRAILARQPAHVAALNMLGEALQPTDAAGAEDAWRRVIAIDARNAEAWFHLGNLYAERGDTGASIAALEEARARAPGNASVLVNLGLQLDRAGRAEEAERRYRDALASRPDQVEVLANLAELLFRAARYAEALPLYDRVVERAPGASASVWNNRGVCEKYTWNNSAALASFQRAARLAPDSPEVLANLGFAECERGRYEQARVHLERAHALAPQRLQVTAQLLDIHLQLAEWHALAEQRAALVAAVEALDDDARQTVPPFAFMSVCDDPRLQLRAAQSFAWPAEPPAAPAKASPARDARLRLGFVSTVFHEHPVPRLIIDLLERLDRERFEVYAYLVAAGTDDAMRARVARTCAAFRDVTGASAADIVQRIRDDGIDVLFDIAGHTEYARPDVFAARAAPLQINYLGQAGTLGAPYYDYIGTDAYTTPPEDQAYYAERFWFLGDCYFPCDPRRPLAEPPPSREAYGLPGDAFVLMCQAAAHKVTPPMFDAWTRLLHDIADAVLWLRPMLPPAQANVRAAARERGIDPARIVFAPKEPLPVYLARFRLADLYLDTHPFGSHTTVNDALYAGLPVVTLAGRSVAGRASASQVRAVGLPELIAATLDEYEARVRALARDRAELARITGRLRTECRGSALFDMGRYARSFEDGLLELWARHRAEGQPASAA
jgi:predicted O-linked N-acetylglucosamine transferase (SPINDLY family)